MRVRIQNKDLFSEPVIVSDVQTVVITDEDGTPVMIASAIDKRGIWTITADDPTFQENLRRLGVTTREAKVVSLSHMIQRPEKSEK